MHGHDEELLSAFHDGELVGDERAAAERMLAESPAARDARDEFAELRGVLCSLPRPAAPNDLRQDVLRRIASEIPAAAAADRKRRRPSMTWLVSTAACVMIAAGIYLATRDFAQGPDVAMRDSTATDFPLPAAAPPEVPLPRSADQTDAAPPPMAMAPAASEASAAELEGVDLERLRQLIAAGELPAPGELIPDFREIGDQLVLIEYSVVDVQNLYGQVQVVLSRNGIAPVGEDGRLGNASGDASGELYGIYVDAPSEQFVAALREMNLMEGVVAVSTASGDEAERMVAMSQLPGESAAADPHDSANAPPPPSSVRNSRARSEPVADRPDTSLESGSAPDSATATAPQKEAAYQLPFSVKRDLLKPSTQPDQAAGETQPAPADPADQSEQAHEPAAGASDGERVRVVLVFVPQSDE